MGPGAMASPRLSANGLHGAPVQKAAVVFPSHVRRSFGRKPIDYTGELVRLLDDISTVTHSIAAYVSERSESAQYGAPVQHEGALDPAVATRKLYRSLSHDGYACLILEKRMKVPLRLPDDAPQGDYLVVVNSLDLDEHNDGSAVCGTSFSVYKRISSPSLPGRLRDLQQPLSTQVAAGYVVYASATTLYYTIGQGVYSFVLHPVATQYFLQPPDALRLQKDCYDVYADAKKLRNDQSGIGHATLKIAREASPRGNLYDSGCLLANFHGAVASGGVLVSFEAHLLCDAAPFALLVEQMGGRASNGQGKRILDMAVEDDDIHGTTIIVAGPEDIVRAIEMEALAQREANIRGSDKSMG